MTKILLVEDDKSLREIYGVRLLAEGYDIVSAGDGEEALAMAIKERPQLIVSDVMMPKISGFDMLDILRSTTETKDIKVIMMTALSSEDQRVRGEQLGADRYLVKSQVGIEDVVRTVHDVLQDMPSAATTPQQTFGTPRPSAVPRPAAPQQQQTHPSVPQAQPQQMQQAPQEQPATQQQMPAAQSQPQQQMPAPHTPAPQQQAAPAPHMPQQMQQAPQQPQAQPQPQHQAAQSQAFPSLQDSNLPRPTAPFSTPRPASLGERIIHPIEVQESSVDVSSLIAQELDRVNGQPQAPQQQAAPAPHMPQQMQQAPQQPQAQPQPQQMQPQPPFPPQVPPQQ